jgi:hypothetical protein
LGRCLYFVQMDSKELAHRFAYHPPKNDEIKHQHEGVRETLGMLAGQINEVLPDCREKSLAITELELVMFWCNAGIARVLNYQED